MYVLYLNAEWEKKTKPQEKCFVDHALMTLTGFSKNGNEVQNFFFLLRIFNVVLSALPVLYGVIIFLNCDTYELGIMEKLSGTTEVLYDQLVPYPSFGY